MKIKIQKALSVCLRSFKSSKSEFKMAYNARRKGLSVVLF